MLVSDAGLTSGGFGFMQKGGDGRKGPLSSDELEELQELYLTGVSIDELALMFKRSVASIQAMVRRFQSDSPCREGVTWPMVYETLWPERLAIQQGSYYLDGKPIDTRKLTLMAAEMLQAQGRPTPPLPGEWWVFS
jgi:hypothetical protein